MLRLRVWIYQRDITVCFQSLFLGLQAESTRLIYSQRFCTSNQACIHMTKSYLATALWQSWRYWWSTTYVVTLSLLKGLKVVKTGNVLLSTPFHITSPRPFSSRFFSPSSSSLFNSQCWVIMYDTVKSLLRLVHNMNPREACGVSSISLVNSVTFLLE